MQRIQFQPHQREELLRMGIAPQALEYIEIEGLPMARRYLTRPPRKNDVLAELQALHDRCAEARKAIERVLDATGAVPPLKEAQIQIAASQGRHSLGGLRLNRTSQSLAEAIEMVASGIEQSRRPAKSS